MTTKAISQAFLLAVATAVIGLPQGPRTTELPADHSDTTVHQQCTIQNTSFMDGEEVVYKVYYNWAFIWLLAGEVKFTVSETPEAYKIDVIGRTYDSYDHFYRVRDTFETHLDKQTLLPTMFIRDVEEGKYRKYNKFIFDQDNKRVVSYEGKSIDSLERTEVDVSDCMHDILSILYFVRNMYFDEMEENSTFPVEVFLEEEYPLSVKFLEKDRKKRVKGFGKFRTHVFSPQLIKSEVFNENDQMVIYVSADQNRIPLVIESPLSVGKMKAFLETHEGLRYELDAEWE